MKNVIKKLNSSDLQKRAAELKAAALKTNNLFTRHEIYKELQSIEKILKEVIKWETTLRGY